MLKRKSIVLSDAQSSTNKKAVLSIEENLNGIYGTLRLYNFPHELSGISSLGFYVNQKVYKAGLTYKSHMFYEFFIDLKQIPNKFSCAVVNFQNAVATPILYGSSEGCKDDIYGSIITEMSNDNSLKNTEKVLNEYNVNFDEQEQKEIDKQIDDAMCDSCENCANCVYKKFFYENNKEDRVSEILSEQSEEIKPEEHIEDEEKCKNEEEKKVVFFDKLKPQIDKLFENYPAESNLQRIIPSSKWVKVEYEDDGDFYVFGLLYDEDEEIRYVCYGVPAVFEEEPPKELSGFPIWLPLDKNNLKGFGYWLTYQDATTGEPVKAILD